MSVLLNIDHLVWISVNVAVVENRYTDRPAVGERQDGVGVAIVRAHDEHALLAAQLQVIQGETDRVGGGRARGGEPAGGTLDPERGDEVEVKRADDRGHDAHR